LMRRHEWGVRVGSENLTDFSELYTPNSKLK